MIKRAVIYARVSLDIQRDNYSIASQVAGCINYAKKHEYTVIGNQFVDPQTGLDSKPGNGAIPAYVDDFSSRELSRPGLDAVLNFLETVGFDVLIVFVLDRLARDPYIRQTLEKEFIARNAKVEYVLGDYDETPQGEVRKDLDATFAKWENAVRVERFNRGKCRKAENGLFVTGKAPYGYKRDENGLAGLSIDEPQAEVIRWIYDMYVNRGYSIKKIIRELENSNIQSHSGQSNWGSTSVNRILTNTAYVGKLYYNKGKSRGKIRLERDHDEWIEIPVSPIVEQWLFDAAEKRFKENLEHMRQNHKYSYLLSGRVWCGCCGHCYAGETHKAGVGRRKTTIQTYRHR